jgi:hypothetical protein
MTNNTITDNTVSFIGSGGVSAYGYTSIIINNNNISYNVGANGGGIYLNTHTDIIVSNNNITGNTGDECGGMKINNYMGLITIINNIISDNNNCGINASGSPITISNNTITGNRTVGDGGGIYLGNSLSTAIANNTIMGNIANQDGGGIFASLSYGGTMTISNNSIKTNSTEMWSGGGVFIAATGGTITMTNNVITSNTANFRGDGVAIITELTAWVITNNTITGNGAAGDGEGFYTRFWSNDDVADIINNIIWNNSLYIDNDGNRDGIPSIVNLYNNDFNHNDGGVAFDIDPSNLDNQDPLFIDAPNGDYHLTCSSPCKDAGRLEGAPADDMDGESRPQGEGIDIGADEFADADGDCVPNNEDICPNDPENDSDSDIICGDIDNCPSTPNGSALGTCIIGNRGLTCTNNDDCGEVGFCSRNQEDYYPPGGNGIGDACECEGNFNCSVDQNVDGLDAATFKADYGRSSISDPCTNAEPCNGDFSCNGNVDGMDAALFKQDFGRSSINNPCPACVAGVEWCGYQ